MFLTGDTFNKIEQPFYHGFCHGLPFAGNKFHLTGEGKGQNDQYDDRKPGGDEGIRDGKVTHVEHGLRRKLHMGFRNLKEDWRLRPKKTVSQGAEHKTDDEED